MKLEIEINEGDDLTFLRVLRGLTAVVRDHAPDAKVRAMAARIHQVLEQVENWPIGSILRGVSALRISGDVC